MGNCPIQLWLFPLFRKFTSLSEHSSPFMNCKIKAVLKLKFRHLYILMNKMYVQYIYKLYTYSVLDPKISPTHPDPRIRKSKLLIRIREGVNYGSGRALTTDPPGHFCDRKTVTFDFVLKFLWIFAKLVSIRNYGSGSRRPIKYGSGRIRNTGTVPTICTCLFTL